MKKERVLLVVIILLIIPLVMLSVKYNKLSQDNDMQSFVINQDFKGSLSRAISGFDADFKNSTDENYKESNYNRAMSGLASARLFIKFTDYNIQNQSFHDALDNLYRVMESGKYKKYIMDNSASIMDSLKKLVADPLDKNAAENILNITEAAREDK